MADGNVFLASLFNATGLGVVALVSAYVQFRSPRPWFGYWTWSFSSGLVALSIEAASMGWGRNLALSVVEAFAVAVNIVLLWTTIYAVRGKPIARTTFTVAGGAIAAFGIAGMASGLDFIVAMALPMILLSISLTALALTLLRGAALTPAQKWIAWPLLALGLHPLTYPLVGGTPHVWIGYWMGGVLNLIVGMGMVVSVMEQAAMELQGANERLRRHDGLKTNIFNNMTHEIRTPLTAIRAAAVAMEKGALPAGEFSSLIGSQVERLDHMLSDILDVAQLESGTLLYAYDDCDLSELVESACRMYQPLFREGERTLACVVPDDPLELTCDRDRLMQVLTNLLENARKFTPKGGHVSVTAEVTPGGFRVTVADDGPGVPPDLREAIFEKFFQADGSSTRRSGGAGLGLAICRAIVENGHGGRIWAEINHGPGATFSVELPRSARPSSTVPTLDARLGARQAS